MTNDPMLGGPEPYQGQGAPAQPDATYQQYPQYPGGYAPTPPQYPTYATPVYPGYYAGPMPQSTNGMAIASLVCSIAGFVIFPLAVLGVIFGHIALKQIKVSQEQGRGYAVAGLVIGYIELALSLLGILLFILLIVISSSTAQPTN